MKKSSRVAPVVSQASTASTSSYVTRDIQSVIPQIRFFLKKLSIRLNKYKQDFSSINNSQDKKKKMKALIPVAILVVIAGGIIIFTGKLLQSATKTAPQDQRIAIPGPKAHEDLNKDFSFPLTDDKGKVVTSVKYTILDAELRDEIVVKGATATAVKGRTFLIVDIKIENSYEKGINMNARDYIRLVVNGKDSELLAADIHNDPVNVQAISTKATRIGFPINDTDHNLTLKVGEITGDKQSIPLNFK